MLHSTPESETPDPRRDLVFISCSPHDATWRTKLVSASRTDARWGHLTWWYPSLGSSADSYELETHAAIRSAKAAVLLLSPEYLASSYAVTELQWIEEERNVRDLPVLPVLLKACPWRENDRLEDLEVRSADRPIAEMSAAVQNEEFAETVKAVAKAVTAERRKESPGLVLSSSARAIVDAARRLARRSQRTVISSSCLLFGLAEQAGNGHDTARFVRDALNRHGRYTSIFEAFLGSPEAALERETIPGLDGEFSENARRILEHASLIAETVCHGSRLINPRHVFAGILAAPVDTLPEARKILVANDLDPVALSAEFLKFLAVHSSGDDQGKWRFILGAASGGLPEVPGEVPFDASHDVIRELFTAFASHLNAMLAACTSHELEQIHGRYEAAKRSFDATQGKAFLESAELAALREEGRALAYQLNEIEASFGNMRTVILVANSVAAVLAGFAARAVDQKEGSPATKPVEVYVAGTAGYTSEYCGVGARGDVPDHLGVQGQAQRLAELIALKETRLPLAIGLFGNWGSGKSHFMNLMDRHMDALSKRDESQWCKQIVPVYFNAWHYSDANLWASLVTEVFDALFKRLEPKVDQLALLQEKLREAGGVSTLAAEEVEQAKRRVASATAALVDAQEASERARERLTFMDGLKTLLPELNTEKNRRRVEELLGVPIDTAVLRDLKEKQSELRSLGGRMRAVWRRILEPEGRAARFAWLAGWVVAMLVVRWVAGHVPWVEEHLRRLGPAAQWLLGAILSLLGWLTPFLRQVRDGLQQLEALQEKAEEAQEKRPAKERVQAAESELQQAEERARKAEIAMEAARVLERQLKSQADELAPERRLSNFIAARARSADYRGQLGLVSLARRDFEELTRIFTDVENQEHRPDTASPEHNAVEAALSASVDRVVLYIDDLDRCEPEKVVDVLQAVHLLLAYRLFAVVVGVDQRCLKQSLRLRFKGLLTPEHAETAQQEGLLDAEDIPATPLDYLEKIFHIPFHLPPMGREGFATLVERLTEPRADSVGVATSRSVGGTEPLRSAYGVRRNDWEVGGSRAQASSPQDGAGAKVRGDGGDAAGGTTGVATSVSEGVSKQDAPLAEEMSSANVQAEDPSAVRRVGSVSLHRWEREALKEFYGPIKTPRGATRLLNTYRLVRAGLPAEEWDRFRCDAGGGGHARFAMLLLAVAAGQPASARTWFTLLRQEGSDEWATPQHHAGGQESEWAEFRRLCASASRQMDPQLDRAFVGLWLDRVERFSF